MDLKELAAQHMDSILFASNLKPNFEEAFGPDEEEWEMQGLKCVEAEELPDNAIIVIKDLKDELED